MGPARAGAASGAGSGVVSHSPDLVLAQRAVDAKTTEIPKALLILAAVDGRGRVVPADALHTQTAFATGRVGDHGGEYGLTVTHHQPTLHTRLAVLALFSRRPGPGTRRTGGSRPGRW